MATSHATHGDVDANRQPKLEVRSDEAQLPKCAGCSLPLHLRNSPLPFRLQSSTAILFYAD
jgi:hypothetical protein